MEFQRLSQKFEKRIDQLKSVEFNSFQHSLVQFWEFFNGEPIFSQINESLQNDFPNVSERVYNIIGNPKATDKVSGNSNESIAFAFELIGYISKCNDQGDLRNALHSIAHPNTFNLSNCRTQQEIDKNYLNIFKDRYLDEVQFYIDEKLDYLESQVEKQSEILKVLIRYKQRSEWFHRSALWKTYENNTRNGEKHLALNLYSYLFDQGIDFYIEPSSIGGEIDLISTENTNDPLLAEAKIFKGNKHYICKAFNQIYTYTKQFNEPTGYLIIYNVSEKNLELSLDTDSQAVPFVFYDNKTIFFIKIDVYPHSESVSQRKPVTSVNIEREDLIRSIKEGI
jgi:hypothetical protein